MLDPLVKRIHETIEFARSVTAVILDPEASELWEQVYPELTQEIPGLYGSAISRAEAQVRRIAMIYALMDHRPMVGIQHLQAALALWEYARASAEHIFGHALGDTKGALDPLLPHGSRPGAIGSPVVFLGGYAAELPHGLPYALAYL